MLEVGAVDILENVELGPMTTLGVGGKARYWVEVTDEASLGAALDWAVKRRVGVQMLGDGSNIVVADEGCDALVIRNRLRGIEAKASDRETLVTVASGEAWDDFVALTVERGWAGLECLSGIPGRVGATPIQNVGAYGQEVGQRVRSVRALDRVTGRRVDLLASTCRFGYRDSLFRSREPGRYVMLSVTFALTPGGEPRVDHPELARTLGEDSRGSLAHVRTAVLELRRRKSMLLDPADENHRSCGSFFVNPVVDDATWKGVERRLGNGATPAYPQPDGRIKLAAGWLVEKAGFGRGTRDGKVGVSTKHALALVCHEGATAVALVRFARRIREAVRECSGVELTPEPIFWGFSTLEAGLPGEEGAGE
jgi:UDP-N-acetylmuramate dehydrogenase